MTTRTHDPKKGAGRIIHGALALGFLGAVACAGPAAVGQRSALASLQPPSAATKYSASYVFTIKYLGGCPDDVDVDPNVANCIPEGGTTPLKACARTRNGEHVVFRWSAAEAEPFVIQFAPFKKWAFSSKGSKPSQAAPGSVEIDEPIAAPVNQDKPYPFSIVPDGTPGKCTKTIDPQVIVDN